MSSQFLSFLLGLLLFVDDIAHFGNARAAAAVVTAGGGGGVDDGVEVSRSVFRFVSFNTRSRCCILLSISTLVFFDATHSSG